MYAITSSSGKAAIAIHKFDFHVFGQYKYFSLQLANTAFQIIRNALQQKHRQKHLGLFFRCRYITVASF